MHYTIDLFTGLVMYHYCFYLAEFVSDLVDKKVLNQEVRTQNQQNRIVFNAKTKPLLVENVSNYLEKIYVN